MFRIALGNDGLQLGRVRAAFRVLLRCSQNWLALLQAQISLLTIKINKVMLDLLSRVDIVQHLLL